MLAVQVRRWAPAERETMDQSTILNQAVIITAKTMFKEGFIDESQYLDILNNYFIVTNETNVLTKIHKKLWNRNKTSEHTHFDMVKMILPDNAEHDLELTNLRNQRKEELNKQPSKDQNESRFSDLET